jgi:hypothetical protein
MIQDEAVKCRHCHSAVGMSAHKGGAKIPSWLAVFLIVLLAFIAWGSIQTTPVTSQSQGAAVVAANTEIPTPQNIYELNKKLPRDVKRDAVDDLPAYTILRQDYVFTSGGKTIRKDGVILIPEYSQKTPKRLVFETLRKILAKEGFGQGNIYSTVEAFQAEMSAIFAKAHPDALKTGHIGGILEGDFFYRDSEGHLVFEEIKNGTLSGVVR